MPAPAETKKDSIDRAIDVLRATPLRPAEAVPAVDALGESGDPRAVEPLIDLLKRSRDLTIKIHVCDALGHIGDPRAIDPLIEKLQDRDDDFYVRKKAAYTLYAIYRHGHLDQEQRDKIVTHWRSWYLL
ncbi:MAG: HEAT repeat domain-containing protein [Methanocella sp.]